MKPPQPNHNTNGRQIIIGLYLCLTCCVISCYSSDINAEKSFENTRVLRIALAHNPPFDTITRGSNGTLIWKGASRPLSYWLAKRLNYSLEWVYPTEDDLKLRGLEATVDLVARKEADFVMCGLAITPGRLAVIDPGTFIAWEEPYRLIVPIPGEEDRLFAFIRPFDSTIWMLLATSVFITAVSMSLLSWAYDRLNSRTNINKENNQQTSVHEYFESYFFYIVNVLTNHGDYLKLTHVTSFLICVAVWLAGASILVYGYSCIVVSSLTAPKVKPIINSFQDLLTSNDVSIIIRSDVVMGQLILTNDAPVYKALREKAARDPNSLTTRNTTAINELLIAGKHAYPFAETFDRFFIASEYKRSGKCKNKLSKRIPVSINFLYMFFQKDSRLRREFSIASMELWETGQTRFWVNNELPRAEKCFATVRSNGIKQSAIKLVDLTSAFFILGVGITLSLFTFIAELVVKRLAARQR